MKYILRNKSVITGKENLEHLYTFKDFPVFIGSTDQSESEDLLADMSFSICKDTGIIQLDKVLPYAVVYSGYHSEAIGGIWEEHRAAFIDFISKYEFKKVLELGGGNGSTAKQFLTNRKEVKWTIVETNPTKVENENIKVIVKIFDENFTLDEDIDALVHSHFFEHLYEPRLVMENISRILSEGKLHLFSIPNLYAYMRNRFTNCMNFEHTVFLTEYFMDYLLNLNGFEILEKKYFHEHSIFYATRKKSDVDKFNFENKYDEYKKEFFDYLNYNSEIIKKINGEIKAFSGDVYLFGAHVFSQYLLNQGLLRGKVVGILDNSKIKQGKRLYGTTFYINSPEILGNLRDTAVILKAGSYQEEIRNQLISLNNNLKIME